jgi:beta-glucanase (GH16 family)
LRNHGYFKLRAKLPCGRATWPAIWTLGRSIDDTFFPVTMEIDHVRVYPVPR